MGSVTTTELGADFLFSFNNTSAFWIWELLSKETESLESRSSKLGVYASRPPSAKSSVPDVYALSERYLVNMDWPGTEPKPPL
jgi:hypothetical protein